MLIIFNPQAIVLRVLIFSLWVIVFRVQSNTEKHKVGSHFTPPRSGVWNEHLPHCNHELLWVENAYGMLRVGNPCQPQLKEETIA